VAQAAVQDPDQPVRQGAERLMVGGATSPMGVVVVAGPRRSGQRRERPQMTGGAQPPIPHRPGQDYLPLPRGPVMGAVPA